MQILDDGGQGVCEAMPDDSISMLLGRLRTGRALTKPFGTTRPSGPFHIRTLTTATRAAAARRPASPKAT